MQSSKYDEDPVFDWNVKQVYQLLNCQAVALNRFRIRVVARVMQGVVSSRAVMKARSNAARRGIGVSSRKGILDGNTLGRGFMGDIQIEVSKKRMQEGETVI